MPNAANPFYVHPGGDLTQGLAGIGQTLGNIGDQRRADAELARKEKAEKDALAKVAAIKAEGQEVFASKDPKRIAEYAIRNKDLGKIVTEQYNFHNDRTKENYIDSLYRYINNQEDAPKIVEGRVDFLDAEGVPQEQRKGTIDFMRKHAEDPDGTLASAIAEISFLDPTRSQSFLKGKGIGGGEAKPAEQVAFEALIKDFSPEDQVKAKEVKAGLTARAVGSSDMTIQQLGIAELIGDAQATMKERAKFGEMQGSQRSQAIDKGFEKVQKLQQNITNLDNAIDAVKAGAGTGAIEKRFPSLKESSVLLDQVQGALALDVIGSVTFGALSEGELNLAKAIAIPTSLEGPALEKWLGDKKEAQIKLLNYFKEQIDFLDQGGSVAGFLRKKGRESNGQDNQQQKTVIRFDSQGNIVQ